MPTRSVRTATHRRTLRAIADRCLSLCWVSLDLGRARRDEEHNAAQLERGTRATIAGHTESPRTDFAVAVDYAQSRHPSPDSPKQHTCVRDGIQRWSRARRLFSCRRTLRAFADSLTSQHRCCCARRPATAPCPFASSSQDKLGRDVLSSTDAGRNWPKVPPITAIGVIDSFEEERGHPVEDWLITLGLDDTAFIEFHAATLNPPRRTSCSARCACGKDRQR
jgi:hypothetical protein